MHRQFNIPAPCDQPLMNERAAYEDQAVRYRASVLDA